MRTRIFMYVCLVFIAVLMLAPNYGCKENEETVLGKITEKGSLMGDDGMLYTMEGEKALEVKHRIGKKYQIKGTVKERFGNTTIFVQEYKLIETPGEQAISPDESSNLYMPGFPLPAEQRESGPTSEKEK